MKKNNPLLDEIDHLPDSYEIGGFIPSAFQLDESMKQDNPLIAYKDAADELDEVDPHSRANVQLEHDFDKARSNIKSILDSTSSLLTDAIALAQSSDSPRAFDTVAVLMKTMANVNRDLLELHDQRETIKGKRTVIAPTLTQNNQNNHFYGSPAEFAKHLQDEK